MSDYIEPRWDGSEESDYEFVAEVDWDHEAYQFNMTRVYAHKTTGELFYATDSGCSCPSPFEDTKTGELKPIRRMQDWYDHVTANVIEAGDDPEDQYPYPTPAAALGEVETARRAIRARLKASK